MEQPDAVILTAIGIGAAFGVLVALSLAALLIRLIAWAVDKLVARRRGVSAVETVKTSDPETLNRARAAAVAVSALIESKPALYQDDSGGRDSDGR